MLPNNFPKSMLCLFIIIHYVEGELLRLKDLRVSQQKIRGADYRYIISFLSAFHFTSRGEEIQAGLLGCCGLSHLFM